MRLVIEIIVLGFSACVVAFLVSACTNSFYKQEFPGNGSGRD